MSDTFNLALRRRRIANGGWEWFFSLDDTPLYPSANVGFFSGPEMTPEEAFRNVILRWGRS